MSKRFNSYNKRIVFLGDSITQNGLFIAYMDAYFMRHLPELRPEFINLGVSSETVSGLSEPDHPWPRPCAHNRLRKALVESRPEIVVACYGINDGIYYPYSEARFEAYKRGLGSLIGEVRKTGAAVVLMTPPPFDEASIDGGILLPEGCSKYSYLQPFKEYNVVMKKYADYIKSLMKEADKIVDINTPMWTNIEEQRKKNSQFKSGDGIHPDKNGHWIIAKVLLKTLFNITLELKPEFASSDRAPGWFDTVVERHQLLSNAWREHVGHDNPDKAETLSLGEAQSAAAVLDERIKLLIDLQKEDELIHKSEWKGYLRYDFYVQGREAILIVPKAKSEGNPWIWRAEFFDAFSQADMAMVQKGWHLAYFRISDMYGSPEAVKLMRVFQDFVVKKFSLREKTVLFGFSRGGLYSFNYAAEYPEKVSGLYLDAPVLDIKSWPGGRGKGIGAPVQWEECKEVYDLKEENISNFKESPVDKITSAAKADIPIALVAGDSDKVVPYEENGAVLVEKYKALGGKIEVIVKPGIDHHPHSLENPQPIIDFILNYASL